MTKPKILCIIPFPFWPAYGGGEIVMHNHFKALSTQFDIDLLFAYNKDYDISSMLDYINGYATPYPIPLNLTPLPKKTIYKQLQALLQYCFSFSCMPGLMQFYQHKEVQRLLKGNYSFIHLEFATWHHPLLKQRKCPLVLIEHNFETEYWQHLGLSYLCNGQYFWGILYLLGSLKITHQEDCAVNNADLVLTLSSYDQVNIIKRFKPTNKVLLFQSGIDINAYSYPHTNPSQQIKQQQDIKLIFTASFGIPQNIHAAVLFIKHVLPKLQNTGFQYQLFLVGRNPSSYLKQLAGKNKNIILTGPVPDVKPYIAEADIYISPLRYGSGIKIKLMEAMAMGKAIVATPQAIRGLNLTADNALIADTPASFAARILELSHNPSLRIKMGAHNRTHALKHFNGPENFLETLALYPLNHPHK